MPSDNSSLLQDTIRKKETDPPYKLHKSLVKPVSLHNLGKSHIAPLLCKKSRNQPGNIFPPLNPPPTKRGLKIPEKKQAYNIQTKTTYFIPTALPPPRTQP